MLGNRLIGRLGYNSRLGHTFLNQNPLLNAKEQVLLSRVLEDDYYKYPVLKTVSQREEHLC